MHIVDTQSAVPNVPEYPLPRVSLLPLLSSFLPSSREALLKATCKYIPKGRPGANHAAERPWLRVLFQDDGEPWMVIK